MIMFQALFLKQETFFPNFLCQPPSRGARLAVATHSPCSLRKDRKTQCTGFRVKQGKRKARGNGNHCISCGSGIRNEEWKRT